MTTLMASRKAQLSFDLAFALILVMIVLGMVTSYQNNVEASLNVVNSRALMGLNVIADYTTGDLNAFYNSLVQMPSANATHTLELPGNDTLFSDPTGSNKYELNYTVTFPVDKTIKFADMSDPSVSLTRTTGYSIMCSPSRISLSKSPGTTITLTECKISGDNMACRSCA